MHACAFLDENPYQIKGYLTDQLEVLPLVFSIFIKAVQVSVVTAE